MKKILFLVFFIFSLSSCNILSQTDELGAVEEAGEIVNNYADTLEGSIQDARSVKEQYEKRADSFDTNSTK